MSTRLTYVGTNTRRRPSRDAGRIRPVPPARPGPWTEDGLTSTRSWPTSREVASAARSPSVLVRSYVDRYQPREGVPVVSRAADDLDARGRQRSRRRIRARQPDDLVAPIEQTRHERSADESR